jgi:hypothetical protein
MQGKGLLTLLKHFAKHAKLEKDNKIFLLGGNHEIHLYVPATYFCRENGTILLSVPPHCCRRFQPLDVAVYGTFVGFVNSAMDPWMKSRP